MVQEDVSRIASSHQDNLTSLVADLSSFKEEIYRSHLTFDLKSGASSSATTSVENMKQSLDKWRDDIRSRLTAVDELCRDSADTMSPEQFAQLKEARNKLATEYDDVVRTVEGVYGRVNVIASLLMEFSSQASQMQSWITDRTRYAASLLQKSTDPSSLQEARREARTLLAEITDKEQSIKSLNSVLSKLQREIDLLHEEAPNQADCNLNAEEVHLTMYRVQDDYSALAKECQDLLQYQNRIESLDQDLVQSTRMVDELFNEIESNIEQSGGVSGSSVDDKVRSLEKLGEKTSTAGDRLMQAEQANLRLISALESMGVENTIKDQKNGEVEKRRKRHADLLEQIQGKLNEASAEKAANEGVRDAVYDLCEWSKNFEEKLSQSLPLPLLEDDLIELKREEQRMHSELESRQAVLNQLEKEVARLSLTESPSASGTNVEQQLVATRKQLQRSSSILRGLRDNVSDALSGVQSLARGSDALLHSCESASVLVHSTNPRDPSRIEVCSEALEGLNSQLHNIKSAADSLKAIPNTVDFDNVDRIVSESERRVMAVAQSLGGIRDKVAEDQELEAQFDEMKERYSDWLGEIDRSLMELGPVSIVQARLMKQRGECSALSQKHAEGSAGLEELESLCARLPDGGARNRASSVPRHVMDLIARYNGQSDAIRSRLEKINRNEQQTLDLEQAQSGLRLWMDTQHKLIAEQPFSNTKEEVHSNSELYDRLDKGARNEQRRLEEAHVKAFELARSASIEEEATAVKVADEELTQKWNSQNEQLEGARVRNRQAEQLLDDSLQLDKWLVAKGRMMKVIGAPSTEPALIRSQMGQLQIMTAEAEGEHETLDRVNKLAEALLESCPDGSLDRLRTKIGDLNQRWNDLEEDIEQKNASVEKAQQLGNDIRALQKQIKRENVDLDDGIERTLSMAPSDADKQLAALDELSQRLSSLDDLVGELEKRVELVDDLEVDPGNRADIDEHLESTKKKTGELKNRIDSVKSAVLRTRDEGDALESSLDVLLDMARKAESEIKEAPPISADSQKLEEQTAALDALYQNTLTREGDVSLIKAKVADQLKSYPDPALKSKLDELSRTWNPLIAAVKDRRNDLAKMSELVRNFSDNEKALAGRLLEDEKEMEAVIGGNDKSAVIDALKIMENVLGRRFADAEALQGVVGRIEASAPGPDANKIKKKADNLLDDCKQLTKKAKLAEQSAQKKIDAQNKFDRLMDDVKQFVSMQNSALNDTPNNLNTKDRIQSRIAEVEGFANRKNREIRNGADELKLVSNEQEAEDIDNAVDGVKHDFGNVLAALQAVDMQLEEKQGAADVARDHTDGLSGKANALIAEIGDLDAVGRGRGELERQKSECDKLADDVEACESETLAVLAEWDAALGAGVVSRPQWEANKINVDNIAKLLGRGKKKLGQRAKKIEQTEQEVHKIGSDAADLAAELDGLRESGALQGAIDTSVPNKQALQLKQFKESLRPIGSKVDTLVSECKVLIRSAGPDADTAELDASLQHVSGAWSALTAAVADRENKVDAAVQEMGRYDDAHKGLLNWLEETEEMLENQRPPAADAKVAKAQLHAYDVLLKHIEDKDTSVKGFAALIGKIVEVTESPEEKSSLEQKKSSISKRYDDLLANAQDRQHRLMEAVDLAERLVEDTVPLESWIGKAEKRLQALSNVAADARKMEAQLEEQQLLENEIYQKGEKVDAVLAIVPMLCSLVNLEDANSLEASANQIANRYESLSNRTRLIKDLLIDAATQVGDFEHDTNELSVWLDEMEERMLDVDELAIEPDDLLEQSNILTDLAIAVTERDALVSSVISVGRELSKQTTADEAVSLQNRVETLKMRFADVMYVADEKIAALSKAIPLSERFHEGFDAVMQWVEAVEEDLVHVDEADLETQSHLVFTMEEDVTRWRPEVEELVSVSNHLQALSGPERADELYQNTSEMNRRVNQIADKVSRRAERLDLTDKQSRVVLDELEFLVDWLSDARERVVMAGPPSIDPEFVKAQLKNQRIMNEDVTANKARLRIVVTEAKKVIRQIGADGAEGAAYAALAEKADRGKELIDEVASLCMDRTEYLERAAVLAEQLTAEFEELSTWTDRVDEELRSAPEVTTTTSPAELRRMHDHNSELLRSIGVYKPIVDSFAADARDLRELCSEHDGQKLGELTDEMLAKYAELGDAARGRSQALDVILNATSGFGERLESFVQNLQGAADRLRGNEAMSADPAVLESRLSENKAILEGLRQKEAAYASLRDSAAELLASAPHGDIAAEDVTGKLDRLEKLWRDIEKEAAERGGYLQDVLEKAKHFWSELDQCQKAVDDLRVRLESVEPATGQPEQLQRQQAEMESVAGALTIAEPRIISLRVASDALSSVIPNEEKVIVEAQVDAVNGGWNTITRLFTEKNRDLIAAMEDAMTFHGDLANLLGWLDEAERHVTTFPPADQLKIGEIPAHLDELHKFKASVDKQGIVKEQLAQTASQLVAGAPAHHAAAVRQPISELNARWARLYGAMSDQEHKVEKVLLQMGRLAEAADQLIAWMDHTHGTLVELSAGGPRNLRHIEIQMCKLAVLKNDVQSHEQSVATLNAAAKRLLLDKSDPETCAKIDLMNSKWKELQQALDALAAQMDTAKNEAESVGGELERWLSWLDDVEGVLTTTRPTGGLPETAEAQMDDFRVLKAEVDQNSSALDDYLRETEKYLADHGNDNESWIGRSHIRMKTKWTKVKELCVDRSKKLELALTEAIALDASMRETAEWLTEAEHHLANLSPVSRLVETVEQQVHDNENWNDNIVERKHLMTEQQAAGTRLQYYCEKKDAIPIKNGLVSLKHRFEKVVSRTNERTKQLTAAAEEARVWTSGLESLNDWMDDMQSKLAEEQPSTSSVDRLKLQLEMIKELQSELSQRQPQFEMTRKRGVSLAEFAPRPESKIITARNNEMSKRWNDLSSLCTDRQRSAEQAVLEGGEFEESVLELEQWIDDELARILAHDNEKVAGDVDTVHELKEEEKRRSAERKGKKQGVDTVLKKASTMMSQGVDESASVEEAMSRLRDKWQQIEQAAGDRAAALDRAEVDAADFDGKAHAMLDWLAATEGRLKGPVTNIAAALDTVNSLRADMEEARGKKEDCLKLGNDILSRCHPRADQPLKHWIRVVNCRWKEVEDRAADREFTLLEEEQNEKERDEKLRELQKFVAAKKEQLVGMTAQPVANDLETMDRMQVEHDQLDFELRGRQTDIDDVIKGARKGVSDPNANKLTQDWKQLWLDLLGHQTAMEKQRALLDEMKRLEGWKWEDWKERYVEWNDHGKARVSDLFRRIDRSHTGNVPRNDFINGIIASKFPSSRLEMDKVADKFDKGDGLINSKEFINALRFDMSNRSRAPINDHEKINEEMLKQKTACSCCQPYKIEKISEGHYRFGDTQIKRMVRILRSTVMVRVGGGWESLDEFLGKHDPCRAKGRLNINMFYKDVAPSAAIDTMRAFTKNRHSRVPASGTPGPIMKIREKTERSMPMFGAGTSRAGSDLSLAESRIGRPSLASSRTSLLDGSSRPPSRASDLDSERPTRIPSLRGKKGSRYAPPSAR